MKIAKKILVAMLALALLTSAFIFSATATDTFNAPGMDDVEDILEYYTLEDYVADNFNNGTWTTEYIDSNATGAVVAAKDPTNAENGVMGITIPFMKTAGYKMELPKEERVNGLTDKLLLTFKVYFDESATNELFFELKVGTVNDKNVATSSQFTVLQFNFAKGKNGGVPGFYYSSWNDATQQFGSTVTPVEGVAPQTGMWYDVVISFNAAEDLYSFNVSDLEGNAVVSSENIPLPGIKSVWGFYCYGQFYNTSSDRKPSTTFYLDDMEIYEGSYVRYPSRIDDITTTHLQDLDALYNVDTTDFATKLRIASVLYYLYNEAEGFSVGGAMPNAHKYINETYAQALSDAAGAINTGAAYDERVAQTDLIAEYSAKLPTPETLNGAAGITAELEAAVIAARAAYAEEIATLATVKEQSDAFIALMDEYDDDNREYGYITEYFASASDADKYAKRDATYGRVAKANEIFEGLKSKAERMTADINAFMGAVERMEVATTFGPLFMAYTEANASYTKYGTDAVINPDFDQSTKEGLEDKIASYEAKVDFVLATAAICDDFKRIINEATISSYYSSLIGELEEAAVVREEFGDYEMDYPGLADSVAIYEELVAAVATSKSAVEAYITAVNAIATKTTFAEMKAAVTAALALKAEGDVLGIEGVVEANIALTNAEARVNFLEASSNTFISLVEQLKAADTLTERRALIHLANASALNAEDTYTGVSAAKGDLATEIAEFEADVAAANAALESATKSAQAIVSSVDNSKIFVKGN